MLASPGALPGGHAHGFEFKWDGIRALLHWDGRTLRLFSRNAKDLTAAFPELHALADQLGPRSAVLDGEVVALDGEGRPDFGLLQQRLGRVGEANVRGAARVVPASYLLFDLLHLDGQDIMGQSYRERQRLLRGLKLEGPAWSTTRHDTDGAAMLRTSQAMGLEGVVAKRLDSPYLPGQRTDLWVKVRNRMRQEFVVGGWSEGQGSRAGTVGSLLLGHYGSREEGRLVYVGRCGSGLGGAALAQVEASLRSLAGPSPFDASADGEEPDVHYVKPRLVVEVEFSGLTREGRVRQAAFKGLRTDKAPREVVWEQAEPPADTPRAPQRRRRKPARRA
jgi:bifunctional non-homologous end joining protein LigD